MLEQAITEIQNIERSVAEKRSRIYKFAWLYAPASRNCAHCQSRATRRA